MAATPVLFFTREEHERRIARARAHAMRDLDAL